MDGWMDEALQTPEYSLCMYLLKSLSLSFHVFPIFTVPFLITEQAMMLRLTFAAEGTKDLKTM